MKKDFHILIVEDDADLRKAIERQLSNSGYHVRLARDGKECRQQILSLPVNLVLMDIMLPDDNGVELAKTIRNTAISKDAYILFMSGKETYQKKLGKTGEELAIGFISKPMKMSDLSERIGLIYRVLESERRKRQYELKYKDLLAKASDLIFTLDSMGLITSLNPAFELITDQKTKDWIGRDFAEILNKNDRKTWNDNFQQVKENVTVPVFEIKLEGIKGKNIPMSVLLSLINNPIENHMIMGFAKDLRDRKLLDMHWDQHQEGQREMDTWNDMSSSNTSVTSGIYEASAMIKSNQSVYHALIDNYGQVIQKSIDARIYKMKYHPRIELKEIANTLGFYKASPKDVIELHSDYYASKIEGSHPKRKKVYFEEARIILLQLMGYLVDYYRNRNF